MADYIEKDKVLGLLHYNCDEACSAVVTEAESIPAADVALVRRGRWQKAEDGSYYCSVCGRSAVEIGPYRGHAYFTPEFCCYCGAKMDGGKDDG